MAITTSVASTYVSSVNRFDPQFFNPDYLRLEKRLKLVNTQSLASLCIVSDGNHASVSQHFSNSAVTGPRYLRGQDIGDFFLGDSKSVYIPPSVFATMKRSHMYAGDVLLSIVGTIGALSLVPDDAGDLTGSCKIAILRPRAGVISSQYLAAFLASKYGQFQLRRWTRGTVQTGFILEDMRFIRTARLGSAEIEIAEIVGASYKSRRESKVLFNEASSLLQQELGVRDIDLSPRIAYESSLSALEKARRWDSEYFKPKYHDVIQSVLAASKVPVKGVRPIGRLFAFLTNGHTPVHHDLSIGQVLFLTAEHVSDFRVDFHTDKRILMKHHTKLLARTALCEGDVLVTIKGKVGNCAVVRGCPSYANINQDVALVRLRDGEHPYFLAAWFNSLPGKQLVEQRSTGGINPFLGLGNLRGLPFPILPRGDRERIGGLVQERVERAQAAEAASVRLIERATRRVEELIEKGAG